MRTILSLFPRLVAFTKSRQRVNSQGERLAATAISKLVVANCHEESAKAAGLKWQFPLLHA
jgi:hypothetical protein